MAVGLGSLVGLAGLALVSPAKKDPAICDMTNDFAAAFAQLLFAPLHVLIVLAVFILATATLRYHDWLP